jgi:hypothetical protein
VPAVTALMRDVQALAIFSNLEPHEVEDFRHNYPDFVPQAWWEYAPGLTSKLGKESSGELGIPAKQWQINQGFLRIAWEQKFERDAFGLVRLLLSVFDPVPMLDRIQFETSHGGGNGNTKPIFAELIDLQRSYPYRDAVSFLFEHPWRAKFCAQCHKRFVAVERNNKYCSESCSHEAHIGQKRKYWHKKGGGSEQRAAGNAITKGFVPKGRKMTTWRPGKPVKKK